MIPAFTPKIEKYLASLCKAEVNIFRTCFPDHITKVSCKNFLDILMRKSALKTCDTKVNRVLPCKHTISVACSTKNNNPPPKCFENVQEIFVYPCGLLSHSVKPSVCHELTKLQQLDNPKCNKQITCSRFRCSHTVSVPCYLKKSIEMIKVGSVLKADLNGKMIVASNVQYCQGESEISQCQERVGYRYQLCGHIRLDLPCGIAFSWASDNDLEEPCQELITFTNNVCGHEGKAACFEVQSMQSNWNPWSKVQNKPLLKEFVLKLD